MNKYPLTVKRTSMTGQSRIPSKSVLANSVLTDLHIEHWGGGGGGELKGELGEANEATRMVDK